MRPPEAILWDWDNTLVDNWAALTAAVNVAFAAFDLPAWTEVDMRTRAVGSIRDTFPTLFGPEWKRARDIFFNAFDALHIQELREMPGAAIALSAGAAWPQAVVSNKSGKYLRREVVHLGWAGHFRSLVGAGDAGADKPHPAPIWHALSEIGMPPGPTIWYVGDTESDMRAARAAGCRAVLIGEAGNSIGTQALKRRSTAPDLLSLDVLGDDLYDDYYADASALAARLRVLRQGGSSANGMD